MKKHTQVYYDAFGYDKDDPTFFVKSELSDERAVDIHHIVTREDRIENLMAVTRLEHEEYGEIKMYMWWLLQIHKKTLMVHKIDFDESWFEEQITKYKPFAGVLDE